MIAVSPGGKEVIKVKVVEIHRKMREAKEMKVHGT